MPIWRLLSLEIPIAIWKENTMLTQTPCPPDVQETLKKSEKQIKAGWIAASCTTFVTLWFALASINGYQNFGCDFWNLLDVILLVTFTFGIYEHSRFAAT